MKPAPSIEPKQGPALAAYLDEGGPERRRALRYEMQIGAFIELERGGDMRCHMVDVSDTGALLRPGDVLLCPSQFLLKPDVGTQRKCAVVWTNGRLLAVRFVDEKAPPMTGYDWAALGSDPVADLIDAHGAFTAEDRSPSI
jgi:PilZ domain